MSLQMRIQSRPGKVPPSTVFLTKHGGTFHQSISSKLCSRTVFLNNLKNQRKSSNRFRAVPISKPTVQRGGRGNKDVLDSFSVKNCRVGSQCGTTSNSTVTFRPNFKYFRWEGNWHIIPTKYELLPEKEVNRRMKIKLRNRGKVPWNRGPNHLPEKIVDTHNSMIESVRRKDIWQTSQKNVKFDLGMYKESISEIEMKQLNELEQREVEMRKKISRAIKKKWLDPDFRKSALERMKEKRNQNHYTFRSKKYQQKVKKASKALKECREKYNELTESITTITVEIDTLESLKSIFPPDDELTVKIDEVVVVAKNTISRLKNTMLRVEERLNINPVTSPI